MQRNAKQLLAILVLLFAAPAFLITVRAARQDKPEPPKIIRKSGGVLQGSATRRVEPSYPPLAKKVGVSGAVVVEVMVDEEGNVSSARAISGHPLLKDAATDAARGWVFTPTMLQGVPVKVIGTITFNFSLDNPEDIERVKQQVAEKPDNPQLLIKLGFLYISASENDKAVEAFQRAVAIKPDLAQAWIGIGKAYEGMDRLNEAINAYQQVLQLHADLDVTFTAYRFMGTAYFNHQQYPEAIEAYKQALTKYPNADSIRVPLAGAYLKVGDKASALEQYQILKERHPEYAEPLLKQINDQQ